MAMPGFSNSSLCAEVLFLLLGFRRGWSDRSRSREGRGSGEGVDGVRRCRRREPLGTRRQRSQLEPKSHKEHLSEGIAKKHREESGGGRRRYRRVRSQRWGPRKREDCCCRTRGCHRGGGAAVCYVHDPDGVGKAEAARQRRAPAVPVAPSKEGFALLRHRVQYRNYDTAILHALHRQNDRGQGRRQGPCDLTPTVIELASKPGIIFCAHTSTHTRRDAYDLWKSGI
ncbi:Uncharacterized protein M6B38_236780 [Iris pallida]|uniref:Uncharacterized protein n=1 Tax=Iris pallida TaxID=29817 RepID=A0AAX6DNQ1_IRIPA|nr:Uncharacterized protein M6B38_236780 [Iris pallida]